MKRHHRKLHHRYGRAVSGPVDEHALNELDLYAENTSELYNQKKSILANLAKKAAKGVYDPKLAAKLWLYWVDAAAKMYKKEFPAANFSGMFNKATREKLASELADRYPRGEE
jgi:hypothetical protein